MTKYSNPKVYAKAIVGAIITYIGTVYGVAGGNVDAINWLDMNAIIPALLALGVIFGVPNKSTEPAPEVLSPADAVIANLPEVIRQASIAAAEVERVKEAAATALGNVPVLGPLATQMINSLPKLP